MKPDVPGSERATKLAGVPRPLLTALVWIAFAILLARDFAFAVGHPWCNWDLIGYVGLSLAPHTPPEDLHARTFDEIEATVPPSTFRALTGADAGGYRAEVHRDPEAFRQQLRFYTSRPLYNAAMAALQALGLRPLPSTVWVSALSVALLAALLLHWCLREIGFWALLALPAFVVACALEALARVSSPDGLLACWLVAAVLLLVRGAGRAGLVLLVLSVAVRPDALLFSLPVVVYLRFLAPEPFRLRSVTFAVTAASMLLLYAGIALWADPYGWRTVVHHSFVERLSRPADATDLISTPAYLSLLLELSVKAVTEIENFPIAFYNRGIVFVPAAVLVALVTRRAPAATRLYGHLALLSAGYVVVHFALFPAMVARFFVAQFVIIGMAAVQALRLLAVRRT